MNGHECVAFCEIDKYARQSYKAIHDTTNENEYHDITEVTDDEWKQYRGTVDIICGGFPCQAFSIAGKRGGFDDTRGTLFFEIARAAKQIKPRFLFLENVKGLLSHDKGQTFATILRALDELGYDAEWQLLNSKNFGVPQNRERVFIIGHLRNGRTREVFPFRGQNTISIQQIGNVDQYKRDRVNPQTGRVYDINGLSPTLNTMQGGGLEPKIAIPVLTPDRLEKRQNGRRFKEDGEPSFTLTAQDRHGVVIEDQIIVDSISDEYTFVRKKSQELLDDGGCLPNLYNAYNKTKISEVSPCLTHQSSRASSSGQVIINNGLRIRKLTPLECWRLQGFTDEQFYKAKNDGVSDSQLYKQAGNSVTVNVIDAIARKLI